MLCNVNQSDYAFETGILAYLQTWTGRRGLILRNLVGGLQRFRLQTEALCALQTLATIYKKFHHSDNCGLNVCYWKGALSRQALQKI